MSATDNDDMGFDPLKREAVGWVRHLTSGQATAADAEALRSWCAQSAEHAAAFAAASHLWRDLAPAGRNVRAAALARQSSSAPRPLNRRVLLGGGLAASAAGVYALARPPLGLWPSWSEFAADYRTGTGEQRSVALPGDVSIRMNVQTSIALRPADPGAAWIELLSGEAAFATTGRSFGVRAADRWILADNAQFDVRYVATGGERPVCVTCLKGALKVEGGAEVTAMKQGQQLRYDTRGESLAEADIEVASAWQRGILLFRFTPLADVVEEINRYRPGRIFIVNTEIARLPVSGRFRIDRMDEILTQIQQAFDARVRLLPGGIVLLS
ncbi:FecR domain-containing protein [Bradyrhizobium sp. CER78]|uniref:FecR family protein n=1 Tax=Bradyrhizobium sp. CER78 TaxID=3039162 RepID=UPI00244CE595|nr:FecR domain-containing protein [Bradyrhizobium sp. CER78]MDH2384080.1 FecR domain-containing protein [Bradyrhizobium sp. CER78]